ncbi:MAG: hypothetical protein ACREBR_01965, partial [bacterium]
HANGRGAWQALVKHYMNSTNVDTMTNSIVSELDNLHVTKSGSIGISQYIDEFTKLYSEIVALGQANIYSENRLLNSSTTSK